MQELHQSEARCLTETTFLESVDFSRIILVDRGGKPAILDHDTLPSCGLGETPETVKKKIS